ncbi:udp-glucoronosyl and udp-glucosyl transferase family protein [Colletotrichum truncatum]|uniref:Udp-glucoronosyl and udp-glucosyl transferase family protein n=1 Tax=Colletotrichum truncatum TaxID=5467 RepID=A0ACC3YYG8_COLTU|nr:udp-glucoronosyl and udp-glucosyl transferase family protein [Colletotrichum truncatum]KAF6782046.1 udp-glucoronosyl and udp-glucosyl transferase family protein [Colletotrichum truncatum]
METARQKIMFLTNSDYGQANVVLSIAYVIVRSSPRIEVHIASQSKLKEPMARLVKQVAADIGSAAADALVFHQLIGLSHFDSIDTPGSPGFAPWMTVPSFINVTRNMLDFANLLLPWSVEGFVEIYRDIDRVWNEVKPDVTVSEAMFAPALTFCKSNKMKWIALAPNTIKEFALPLQPRLGMLWKFPMTSTSFPYPVPLHLIPLNVFYTIVAGVIVSTSKRQSQISEHLHRAIDPKIEVFTITHMGLMKAPPEGLRVLVANSPDIDFPFEVIPNFITPCGPITLASPPISDGSQDPELAGWLSRGPTVYMNLGTHHLFDISLAREAALAFRYLLDEAQVSQHHRKLQILWKMPRKSSEGDHTDPSSTEFLGPWQEIKAILGSEIDRDQVRIVNWITAEPKSVLESGHVVLAINHGGANSFHEALCTGIPQVILPGWLDCYDFAQRCEILGIGKWANRKAKPYWERNELGEGLVDTLLGPEAGAMKARAKELGDRHPEGAGREKAAREILALL